ncbi:MAG: hypothetical protein GXX91_06490 [Verrucomicrobiaceae bacterium]|nr:hypothetical protein [Verrucomicrobiaceae bacterium]
MMEKTELRELVGLLEERLRVIGDGDLRERDPDGHLAQLRESSEAITAFHADRRGGIPPRLNHFLENCSYEKALDWARDALAQD